ncbi:hypothetical protein FGADI_1297 [Fusarium gaditjirri]|uniref:Uncharacterized protein n=1 Tax=Fusarium gaditjirri TaxID=282569 RepID=A0A8H4TLE0_9HYPO|nr:hypothetical protein FGADI_1297 [Fusarium gaditjirri]
MSLTRQLALATFANTQWIPARSVDRLSAFLKTWKRTILSKPFGISAKAEQTVDHWGYGPISSRLLDTYSIEPTDDYAKESVKAVASEAAKRRQRLFMVTGVKIARGAIGSISSSRRVGGGARAGFGGESFGVPFDGGPQFNISRDIYDEETYGESSDFVFAYRVRRIVYPKGGW